MPPSPGRANPSDPLAVRFAVDALRHGLDSRLNVPVAGVSYRSGIAPYTSMRPTAPSGWKEQNQRVTPTPKSEQ